MNIIINYYNLYPLLFFTNDILGLGVSWDWAKWWTYDGISGPQFWGLINPEWALCTHGRRQSPINVDPGVLLFDPNLRNIHVDKHRVSGRVNNTGHSVVFSVDEDYAQMENIGGSGLLVHQMPPRPRRKNQPVNITGGPLSYRYRVSQVHLHFGSHDNLGSEHEVNDSTYPAEIQILGFNSELFNNFSDAISKSHGAVGIAILIQIGTKNVNSELKQLTDAMETIRYSGTSSPVRQLSIKGLLPNTDNYITYEGSLTQPPCHETLTWIVMNRPIYINRQQMHGLRKLHQGTVLSPKAKMVNNFRPTQMIHHRPVRTNIDFTPKSPNCPSMHRNKFYAAKNWKR